MANLKKSIEKSARYYGSASRKSDQRAGMYPMSAAQISEYARDQFDDNFHETAASKYKAHFIATLRAEYLGKSARAPQKRMSKAKPPQKRMSKAKPPQKHVKAKELVDRACRNKHLPAFLRKRYC